jgi:hypothetical protein
MQDDGNQPLQVELFAASLRADISDANAFMEALATKLSGSLPMQTQVSRHSSFLSREHPVKEIIVALGDYQYSIIKERKRPVQTSRAKVIRGIVLKTDLIPMDQWISELASSLANEAARSAQARIALEDFLL